MVISHFTCLFTYLKYLLPAGEISKAECSDLGEECLYPGALFMGKKLLPQRASVENVKVQMRKVESTTFLVYCPRAQVLSVQTPQEAQVKKVNML